MNQRCLRPGASALAIVWVLIFAGCSGWESGRTVYGVPFTRVRTDDHGFVIGVIAEDTVVAGRTCKRGWLHLHPNGTPAAFTAAAPVESGRLTAPVGTWVFQDDRGTVTVCAFPRDLEIQNHVCRGTGGPKGAQTSFYPDGALKEFFPAADTRIDGILCRPSPLNGWVELHENGRLKSGRLGEDLVRDGRRHRAGSRVSFDANGRLLP